MAHRKPTRGAEAADSTDAAAHRGTAEPTAGAAEADRAAVERVLEAARRKGRTTLTAPEARRVAEAYAIPTPAEGLATTAEEAEALAERLGTPVALKIVSPDIPHKTEAGGVRTGVSSPREARTAFAEIHANVRAWDADARVDGVQVQRMVPPGREVLVGTATDPTFGPVVAFGLGGTLVEVLEDVTFRLAPAGAEDARSMLDSVRASAVLRGARGAEPVDREALAEVITRVSRLAADFPQLAEVDLNPVIAGPTGAVAADVRVMLNGHRNRPDEPGAPGEQGPAGPGAHGEAETLETMRRLMEPRAVAVIGASNEPGKIGNSVMRNLVDGGFRGAIHPVNPKAGEVLSRTAYASVADIPGEVDVAVFTVPARAVPAALEEVGRKGIPNAVLIPSGFAETGEHQLQETVTAVARRYGTRVLGPNIYGYYSPWQSLCATFCTPYDVRGGVALTSQSGGIGMAVLGFARATGTGVSAIVGLGNKSDTAEHDLLTYFAQDPHTECVAMHLEDLKDGRAFVRAAQETVRTKPVVVLKAGRTAAGSRAAGSHTGALAGNDAVYDDVLRQAGVIRAPGLNEMLEYARALPVLPTPRGDNVVVITGAGGSGVLLSDALVDNGLQPMEIPDDLDASFRALIPPFGSAGNPVDITGGEPPSTYEAAIRLGLRDPRVHALVLGYWHTIVTPPMVFAELTARVVAEAREAGVHKPVVASLAGDVEVEEASAHLFERGVVAYPYTTEKPVAALGAKYRWARAAGALP